MSKLAYIWATFFGAGYFPVASGTFGSLAALPVVWFLATQGVLYLALFSVIVLFTGAYASEKVRIMENGADPSIVVIDEVLGQGISLLMIPASLLDPFSLHGWIIAGTAFVLFRIFDILKPFPASYFDRNMHNGWGIMLDDLCAGMYAMIGTFGVAKLFFS